MAPSVHCLRWRGRQGGQEDHWLQYQYEEELLLVLRNLLCEPLVYQKCSKLGPKTGRCRVFRVSYRRVHAYVGRRGLDWNANLCQADRQERDVLIIIFFQFIKLLQGNESFQYYFSVQKQDLKIVNRIDLWATERALPERLWGTALAQKPRQGRIYHLHRQGSSITSKVLRVSRWDRHRLYWRRTALRSLHRLRPLLVSGRSSIAHKK